MILNPKEQKVIDNIWHPVIRPSQESCSSLSNEELLELINKMDNYIDEVGKLKRDLGDYDEFYLLELDGVKRYLNQEYDERREMVKAR